jgi:hypothetical protein
MEKPNIGIWLILLNLFSISGDGNLLKSLHFGFSFFFFAEILPVKKKGWVERLNECISVANDLQP